MRRVYNGWVKNGFGQTMAFLFVILYIAGTSHVELLHSYFHEHGILVTHSEEQEKDLCHRLIYHKDVQSCHDSHVSVMDKCQACDQASHPDQTTVTDVYHGTRQFVNSYFEFYKLSIDSYWCVLSSSRAPPAIS